MQNKLTHLVFCQELVLSRGTCSNRLLDTAALDKPEVVGWSGTVDRKMSKWFLKREKSPEFSFLRLQGKRLKILAPCTPKVLSLACFTFVGAVEGMEHASERSLGVQSARTFNFLPSNLRNDNSGDFALFKNHLEIFLSTVPDRPSTPGLSRAAVSNSLLEQVPLLNMSS